MEKINKLKVNIYCFLLICFFAVLLSSCATKPPLHERLDKEILRIGVFPSKEDNSKYKQLALSKIENELRSPPFLNGIFGASRNLKLVNRDQLQKIMDEINFQSISGIFSEKEKSELQALGVDVIVVFQVPGVKIQDFKFDKKKHKCVQRNYYAGLRILAVVVSSGETLISDSYEDHGEDIACDDHRYPYEKLKFEEHYISKLLEKISINFISDFNALL